MSGLTQADVVLLFSGHTYLRKIPGPPILHIWGSFFPPVPQAFAAGHSPEAKGVYGPAETMQLKADRSFQV